MMKRTLAAAGVVMMACSTQTATQKADQKETQASRIVCTFMESYDFGGKTIVPFCTSGGSGIGSSARNLHSLAASDVTWLDGERLDSGSSRKDTVSRINGLGLDVTAE